MIICTEYLIYSISCVAKFGEIDQHKTSLIKYLNLECNVIKNALKAKKVMSKVIERFSSS